MIHTKKKIKVNIIIKLIIRINTNIVKIRVEMNRKIVKEGIRTKNNTNKYKFTTKIINNNNFTARNLKPKLIIKTVTIKILNRPVNLRKY